MAEGVEGRQARDLHRRQPRAEGRRLSAQLAGAGMTTTGAGFHRPALFSFRQVPRRAAETAPQGARLICYPASAATADAVLQLLAVQPCQIFRRVVARIIDGL